MKVFSFFLLLLLIVVGCYLKPSPTNDLIHVTSYNPKTDCTTNDYTDATYINNYCYPKSTGSIYYSIQNPNIDIYYCQNSTTCSWCDKIMAYPLNQCTQEDYSDSVIYSIEKMNLKTATVINRVSYSNKECSFASSTASFIQGQCYNQGGDLSLFGVVVKDTIEVVSSAQYNCIGGDTQNFPLNQCLVGSDSNSEFIKVEPF